MDARAVFLIDAAGVVRHSHVYAPGTVPESADLLARFAAI
jgi:alkyl hydroperoxide reductase subunit AhpC